VPSNHPSPGTDEQQKRQRFEMRTNEGGHGMKPCTRC
jgi:hypothetical protein